MVGGEQLQTSQRAALRALRRLQRITQTTNVERDSPATPAGFRGALAGDPAAQSCHGFGRADVGQVRTLRPDVTIPAALSAARVRIESDRRVADGYLTPAVGHNLRTSRHKRASSAATATVPKRSFARWIKGYSRAGTAKRTMRSPARRASSPAKVEPRSAERGGERFKSASMQYTIARSFKVRFCGAAGSVSRGARRARWTAGGGWSF